MIWYCNKPLLSPNASPKKIAVSDLEKMIGNGFKYSESVHRDEKLNLSTTKKTGSDYLSHKIKERFAHPLVDKLVICEMDETVGRGVFARERILFGEVVAEYAGELRLMSPRARLSYGCYVDNNTVVDAENIGGIARFFQHLPHHPDFYAEAAVKKFKENGMACIKDFFELDGVFEDFTETQMDLCAAEFLNILNKDEHKFKESLKTKDPNSIFEFQNNNLSHHWHNIATSNLGMRTIVVEDGGVPHVIFYAKRDIEMGEQVGFTYGLGYWKNLSLWPKLFDVRGNELRIE